MKLLAFIFAALPLAAGAVEWWERPTICRPSDNPCWPAMTGNSFLADGDDAWDGGANCRGKKRVCDNAIIAELGAEHFLTKAQISDPAVVSADFDVDAQNSAASCWGVRKTRNSGTSASVHGKWENVWCDGALADPGEPVAAGFIAGDAEPTCEDLKDRGYIGVLAGSCYGRGGFAANKYYVECAAGAVAPARLAVLNGAADYSAGDNATPSASATQDGADEIFDRMIANAADRRTAVANEK
ncbi:MAG: hypothetical protein LBL46_01660 [Rickettsiales bacterium]|jgi:hypothetical protein|nr:hypothetical protein [Rickettsiales bacterium]